MKSHGNEMINQLDEFDQALDDSNYVLIREYPRAVIMFNSFVEISPLSNPDSKLIKLKYIVF